MATRLSVNVNDETAAALRRLAGKNESSVTEVIRRAVGLYAFVNDELDEGDKELQILDRKSHERTVLALLP